MSKTIEQVIERLNGIDWEETYLDANQKKVLKRKENIAEAFKDYSYDGKSSILIAKDDDDYIEAVLMVDDANAPQINIEILNGIVTASERPRGDRLTYNRFKKYIDQNEIIDNTNEKIEKNVDDPLGILDLQNNEKGEGTINSEKVDISKFTNQNNDDEELQKIFENTPISTEKKIEPEVIPEELVQPVQTTPDPSMVGAVGTPVNSIEEKHQFDKKTVSKDPVESKKREYVEKTEDKAQKILVQTKDGDYVPYEKQETSLFLGSVIDFDVDLEGIIASQCPDNEVVNKQISKRVNTFTTQNEELVKDFLTKLNKFIENNPIYNPSSTLEV